jgi:hypothetical protein
MLSEREMFEKSFERPKNFFNLSEKEQWTIDNSLGILDWEGNDLNVEDLKKFKDHYKKEKVNK